MNEKLLNLLYKSFDASLSSKEKRMLNKGLSESAVLRKEKENILRLRDNLADSRQNSFKPFFTERVMNRVKTSRKQQEIGFHSMVSLFRPIAFATAVILIFLLSYNMKKTENYTLAGALGQEPVTLEKVMDPAYMITME